MRLKQITLRELLLLTLTIAVAMPQIVEGLVGGRQRQRQAPRSFGVSHSELLAMARLVDSGAELVNKGSSHFPNMGICYLETDVELDDSILDACRNGISEKGLSQGWHTQSTIQDIGSCVMHLSQDQVDYQIHLHVLPASQSPQVEGRSVIGLLCICALTSN